MSVAAPVVDYVEPSTRRVYLLAGITEYHPIDDVYAEIRNLRETDESLRQYFMFVQGGGNVPKNAAGTQRTPRYAIFQNCKVVVSGNTYVSGEQLYADENGDVIGKGPDCIDHDLSPYDAYLDYEPPGSEIILVNTGGTFMSEDRIQLELVRKLLVNKQGFDEHFHLVTYDDDGETIIDHQKLFIKDGSKYVPPDDTPFSRTAHIPE
jgi:hypothetical protein